VEGAEEEPHSGTPGSTLVHGTQEKPSSPEEPEYAEPECAEPECAESTYPEPEPEPEPAEPEEAAPAEEKVDLWGYPTIKAKKKKKRSLWPEAPKEEPYES
jgi:hypothetical protein